MIRRAAKKDGNHSAISRALQAIGVGVLDLAKYGMSVDLLTFWRGQIRLLEIKDGSLSPSRRKLTIDEIQLHGLAEKHGCRVHVVHSVDEALALHGAR